MRINAEGLVEQQDGTWSPLSGEVREALHRDLIHLLSHTFTRHGRADIERRLSRLDSLYKPDE